MKNRHFFPFLFVNRKIDCLLLGGAKITYLFALSKKRKKNNNNVSIQHYSKLHQYSTGRNENKVEKNANKNKVTIVNSHRLMSAKVKCCHKKKVANTKKIFIKNVLNGHGAKATQ